MSRFLLSLTFAGLLGLSVWAQSPDSQPSSSQQSARPWPAQDQAGPQPPPKARAPRSDESKDDTASSSNNTKIDLSPPPGDASHPGSAAGEDVNEFHVYDPHKAEKDVEVGDYYFKRKNYAAAISRYRSALNWKPNDAIATFRLGQALEKTGQLEDARRSFQNYLRILPHGPDAEQATQAVQRLTLQSQSRSEDKQR